MWGQFIRFLPVLMLASIAHAADTDGDGMGDSWETFYGLDPNSADDKFLDPDADLLANIDEFLANTDPRSSDTDGDLLMDGEEINVFGTDPHKRDTDGDWLSDAEEVNNFGTDPNKRDTDDDGTSDSLELYHGFNPLLAGDVDADDDNDGLSAIDEIAAGTDPNNRDTDGDWLTDGMESLNGTNPLSPDTDDDVMPDGFEMFYGLDALDPTDGNTDLDNDGFTAYQEFRLGSSPQNQADVPDYLPQNYFESFENGMPAGWYADPDTDHEPWSPSCELTAADGACAISAADDANATINFMGRFAEGVLELSWAAWNPGSNLIVKVDGEEVMSFSGYSPNWDQLSIPLADGVHEISITHEGSEAHWANAGFSLTTLDAFSYATFEPGARRANASCIAPPAGTGESVVELEPLWRDEIGFFTMATKIIQAPNDGSRWFVLEQTGLLKVFDVDNPSDVRVYLDFTSDLLVTPMAGLLSMAFDPEFPAVPEVYVTYVTADNVTTVSRMILDDTDAPMNPIEQKVIVLNQYRSGHYAGDLAFGTDGMLYLTFGDDTYGERAQDTTNLYGKMLRIDVRDVPWPVPSYRNPEGNMFRASNASCGPTPVNSADCPEIFAYGFRNPWRFSIDPPTGEIWLGDVGESDWEEVNLVEMGKNYGWPCYEGPGEGLMYASCTAEQMAGMTAPAVHFSHEEGRSVIGGFVYRGSEIPELYGRYIFADLGRGPVWEVLPDGNGGYVKNQIATSDTVLASMAQDADGELYMGTYYYEGWNPAPFFKMVAADESGEEAPVIATKLSDTGCVDSADPTKPASGVIPYVTNGRFWADNAVKTRYMALPDGTTIDIDGEDDWHYPAGSVLIKNFELEGKLIETRLLMNRYDASLGIPQWEGFSYEWDDEETEATLVMGGKTKMIGEQEWIYPSGTQCLSCHTDAAGGSLSPETAQLNKEFLYPHTVTAMNQIEALDQMGMFTAPVGSPDVLPKLADPFDAELPLDERARAYLHTNCSQCHRPGTGVPSTMDLRYSVLLSNTDVCDVVPEKGDLGIGADARLIAPGSPDNSVLLQRTQRRDSVGMPPLGSTIPDTQGADLLTEWITAMDSCL